MSRAARVALAAALGAFVGVGAAAAGGLPAVPTMLAMAVVLGVIAYRSP